MAAESRTRLGAANLRRFRPEDADAVMAIVAESPEAASWSKESYLRFGEADGSLALVIDVGGQIAGFLVGRRVGDQAEVFNLAVKYACRCKGHGTGLLKAALQELTLQGALSVYLEVRESNTGAIAFYEKQGFSKSGYRKGYYRDPDEAAVVMQKKLTV